MNILNKTDEEIGRAIKAARVLKGLNQNELSKKSGVCRSTIQKAERGGRLTLTSIIKLSEVLGSELERMIQ